MVVFVVSLFIFSRLLNTGTNDMTMDMEEPKFPVVYMGMGDIRYNEMHGYVNAMDTTFMRDTITVLDENRSTQFLWTLTATRCRNLCLKCAAWTGNG